MTASRMPHDTVRAALELAGRAPSVHNSQPWRWRVGATSVHLCTEPRLQLPYTDPDGRDLLVSCGAALHHCVTAFAALGWRAVVHRFPNPGDPQHLAAVELHRAAPSAADVALAGAIPRRRTDRRPFGDVAVGLDDIALMGARAARFGVRLRRFEATADFRVLLAKAAWAHATDPGYVSELSEWSGRHASAAGVPAHSIPHPDPAAPVPGRVFAGSGLETTSRAAGTVDNGVLMALGTVSDDAVSRLRAGEATSAVLLTATTQGLASCLISEPLEVGETRNGVRQLVFDDGEFPQMLVRIGWAFEEPLPPTPRRPLADVMRRLDDQ